MHCSEVDLGLIEKGGLIPVIYTLIIAYCLGHFHLGYGLSCFVKIRVTCFDCLYHYSDCLFLFICCLLGSYYHFLIDQQTSLSTINKVTIYQIRLFAIIMD